MRQYILLTSILMAFSISGCAIYDSNFTCPDSYNGRCVSISEAHRLAKENKDNPQSDPSVEKKNLNSTDNQPSGAPSGANKEDLAHSLYKESLYKRLDSLAKEPTTPIVAPPQVMRILLLPYKGEGNELYMLRYVYFFVDEPRWVLGDSITAIEEE